MAWPSGRYKTFGSGTSFTPADANAIQDMFIRTAGLETADLAPDVPIFPLGTILPYAGATAPHANWKIADGASIATATYPALFTLIGYAYGGSGANFNLPDLRDRIPVSKGTYGGTDTLAETGGSTTHTLSSGEMGNHAHTGSTDWVNADHGHNFVYDTPDVTAGGSTALIMTPDVASVTTFGAANQDHSHTYTSGSSGSGNSHENLMPYIVLNYIVRVL